MKSILCVLIVVIALGSKNVGLADTTGIMDCVLCEVIAQPVQNNIPAVMVASMFKRCSKMGLLEALCNQFVDVHAKQIIRLHSKNLLSSHEICLKLRLCDY
ncbi:Surfactant protein B [Aphelenchoides besseyi]|nr:Surfactant protein B [Aphelenchoides besseyi]KAI6235648.1 Surfactant protein B [Aphelenchoides besseyi]